jgi:lipoprotein-anchoring transpeptidase ErfK/SrfK
MRRFTFVLAGLCCAAAGYSTPAAAYGFDPLTREYVPYHQENVYRPGGSFRAQASPTFRQVVSFSGYAPGTIVISTAERRLYYVVGNGQAIRYGIGVGRPGFTWSGVKTVTAKREWPDWRPPAQMLKRRPDLPRYMAGGINNPLGARAMYLGGSLFRIHGSNEPETIGQAVSSGCIRMTNADVIDLYNRVRIGTRVVVR